VGQKVKKLKTEKKKNGKEKNQKKSERKTTPPLAPFIKSALPGSRTSRFFLADEFYT